MRPPAALYQYKTKNILVMLLNVLIDIVIGCRVERGLGIFLVCALMF
jgi:hypothetical protein